jgi:hypothetical protein
MSLVPDNHNVIASFAASPIFNALLCIFPQTIRRAVSKSGNFDPFQRMDRSTRQPKGYSRASERPHLMIVLCATAAIVTAGFLAATQIQIAPAPVKPTKPLSDDEIYTGSILFVPNDGKICRQLLFDNRTGRTSDNGLVDCGHAYYQTANKPPMQWSSARAQVISESFHRASRSFGVFR